MKKKAVKTKVIFSLLALGAFTISCFRGNDRGEGYRNNYTQHRHDDDMEYEDYGEQEDEMPDGRYEAKVDYHNPETGTSSTYYLDVEVQDKELVKIYWKRGGWLDQSHFSPVDISDGTAKFTSDKGYEYRVELLDY